MAHALVIDDDGVVRGFVQALLERSGWRVTLAETGRDGVRAFHEGRPDVVVLDVNMPGLDGWGALERIRDLSDAPVVMLTVQEDELEKVRALRAGADDYVVKPFAPLEFVARLDALVRRAAGRGRTEVESAFGTARLSVDLVQRIALADGRELTLTPLEFRLLAALVRHSGQVLTKDQLADLVWNDPYVSSDTLKVRVGALRGKLDEAGLPDAIETVRGVGYRYRDP